MDEDTKILNQILDELKAINKKLDIIVSKEYSINEEKTTDEPIETDEEKLNTLTGLTQVV